MLPAGRTSPLSCVWHLSRQPPNTSRPSRTREITTKFQTQMMRFGMRRDSILMLYPAARFVHRSSFHYNKLLARLALIHILISQGSGAPVGHARWGIHGSGARLRRFRGTDVDLNTDPTCKIPAMSYFVYEAGTICTDISMTTDMFECSR